MQNKGRKKQQNLTPFFSTTQLNPVSYTVRLTFPRLLPPLILADTRPIKA